MMATWGEIFSLAVALTRTMHERTDASTGVLRSSQFNQPAFINCLGAEKRQTLLPDSCDAHQNIDVYAANWMQNRRIYSTKTLWLLGIEDITRTITRLE